MFQFRQMLTIAFLAATSLECAVLHAQVSFSYQAYALKNTPQFVVSGDLNGDGKPDLVVSSQNGNILSVLLNNGNGRFAPELDLNPIPNFFTALAVGDFNGDKKLDILALDTGNLNAGTAPGLYVLLGNGDGTLQAPVSTSLGSLNAIIAFIGVGDFNGDGKTDVALYAYDGTNFGPIALSSNGDGTFNTGNLVPAPATLSLVAAVVTDANADGELDLILSYIDDANQQGTILTSLGNGHGTFQPPTQALPTGFLDVHAYDGRFQAPESQRPRVNVLPGGELPVWGLPADWSGGNRRDSTRDSQLHFWCARCAYVWRLRPASDGRFRRRREY